MIAGTLPLTGCAFSCERVNESVTHHVAEQRVIVGKRVLQREDGALAVVRNEHRRDLGQVEELATAAP